MKALVVLSVAFMAAVATVFAVNDKYGAARGDVENLKQILEKTEASRGVAVILSNRSWYVFDSITVSSERDGKGEFVKLLDQLRPKGSREGIIHVVKNVPVRFFPASHSAYRILESLEYEYDNERAILTGEVPSVL